MQDNQNTPQYDFIMQQPNQPKKKLSMPGLGGKMPSSGVIFVVAILVLLLVLSVILFAGKGPKNQSVTDAIARAQEIQRVSTLVKQQSNDANTTDLAATVVLTEASQQKQLVDYMAKRGTKIDPAKQTAYKNSSVDSQVQAAVQNGNIAAYYISYIKTNLGSYQSALSSAYNQSSSAQLKSLLNSAYLSNQAVLKSPGF